MRDQYILVKVQTVYWQGFGFHIAVNFKKCLLWSFGVVSKNNVHNYLEWLLKIILPFPTPYLW